MAGLNGAGRLIGRLVGWLGGVRFYMAKYSQYLWPGMGATMDYYLGYGSFRRFFYALRRPRRPSPGSLSFIVVGSNNDLLCRLVHIAFCIAFYRDILLVFPIAMTLFVLPPQTML